MNEPIRVLHVFGRLDSGGAESRTMDIYRNIDRNKIQFDFAIHTEDECYFSNEIKSLGGEIYSFPRFTGKNFFQYQKAWNNFFKTKKIYNIIHGHQTNVGFFYLREAKRAGIKTRISHSRNANEENRIKQFFSKLSRIYATDWFAVSRLAGISCFGNKNVKSGKVKILPNAIEAKKYSYDLDIRNLKRQELGIIDKFVVGHIGRMHPQKNHKFLCEIFKKMKEVNEDSFLLLIGDGTLKEDIKKHLEKLGLLDSVLFLGVRTDVSELLQAMDCLVFPSFYEGLPGVVLESQAAGLPSVISDKITTEVQVTDYVKFLSLDQSSEDWTDQTFKLVKAMPRKTTFNDIVNAGYNIETVANWYEKFYLQRD